MAGKNKDASLNKRAFTSGFFFILAQLFARGLTFAVTPIYSRLLTQAQYGIVRTYESWLLIAYTVMSLCLWRSVDVAKNDFEEDYNGYVSSVHTLSYIAIAFFFGICMIFKTQVESLHLRQQFLLLYGFLRIRYGMHGFHGFMPKYHRGKKKKLQNHGHRLCICLEFFLG